MNWRWRAMPCITAARGRNKNWAIPTVRPSWRCGLPWQGFHLINLELQAMQRYGGTARTHRSKTMSGVDTKNSDFALQRELLAKVSRTFALTIPALPEHLERVVGNAYLLCRIID